MGNRDCYIKDGLCESQGARQAQVLTLADPEKIRARIKVREFNSYLGLRLLSVCG